MAQVLSVSVNGTLQNPSSTAKTIGLGVNQIRTIEPYVVPASGQPIAGVTLLTVIKMKKDGTQVLNRQWVSATATATVISAANV